MKAQIVRIGNSRGIRLPKPLLEQSKLTSEVELTVENDTIVIRAARAPRQGWEAGFRAMAEHGDDAALLPEYTPNQFDQDEWTW